MTDLSSPSSTLSSNKVALITGASHGIGLEVARQLGKQGMSILLTARSIEKAQAAANALSADGVDVRPYPLDVASDTSVRELAVQITNEMGRLDVLINNAAGYTSWSETPSNADLNTVREVMETTLFGAWRVSQAFLPLIRKSAHGRIVNVSSGAGSHGDPQFGLQATKATAPGYGISKAALNAFTTKLAEEMARTGVLVNAVCPGLTATYPGAEAMGARPIPDGAASVIWAVNLPDDGPSGGFFRDGKPLPWYPQLNSLNHEPRLPIRTSGAKLV